MINKPANQLKSFPVHFSLLAMPGDCCDGKKELSTISARLLHALLSHPSIDVNAADTVSLFVVTAYNICSVCSME